MDTSAYRYTQSIMHTCFEVLGLTVGWQATLTCRVFLNPYFDTTVTRSQLWSLAPPLGGIIVLWVISKAWLSAVRPRRYPRIGDGFTLLFECSMLVGTLAILLTFFSRELGAALSRSFVLLLVPISLVTVFLARYLALVTIITIERRWPSAERVAIVGAGEEAISIVNRLRRSDVPNIHLAGLILPESYQRSSDISCAPVLGTTTTLAAVINSASIDRIIVARNCMTETEAGRCGLVTQKMGVVLSQAIATPAEQFRVAFSDIAGIPFLEFSPRAFSRRYELFKRCFDVFVSTALLVLFLPLMAVAALGVKLTSKGPVFYRSTRVGKGGRHFTFLKFRSMYLPDHAPAAARRPNDGHVFKDKKDKRITPFGRWIRRFSIDELPQLWNVLRGDMSLVGPRPLPASDLDPDGQSQQFANWSEQRSRVLPGITGLWQIRGRSDLSFQDMVRLDVEYIQDWSIGFDLRIIFETPVVVLTGRGAY